MDGGGPMRLDGPITLCGRVDGDPSRRFTGALSQLALFDQTLSEEEVLQLYLAASISMEGALPGGTCCRQAIGRDVGQCRWHRCSACLGGACSGLTSGGLGPPGACMRTLRCCKGWSVLVSAVVLWIREPRLLPVPSYLGCCLEGSRSRLEGSRSRLEGSISRCCWYPTHLAVKAPPAPHSSRQNDAAPRVGCPSLRITALQQAHVVSLARVPPQ